MDLDALDGPLSVPLDAPLLPSSAAAGASATASGSRQPRTPERKRKRQDSDSDGAADSAVSSGSEDDDVGMPEALRLELNAAISEAVFKRVYFDESEDEADGESNPDDPAVLQIGAVVWTREQRAAAYNTLARLGRGRVEAIAAAAGKSNLEVLDFMRVMDEAVVEAALRDRQRPVLGMDDVPAAAEVPDALLARLTDGARRIEGCVQRQQARAEKQKWGELWDLDFDVAMELHRSYKRAVKAELPEAERRRTREPEAMEVDPVQSSRDGAEAAVKCEVDSTAGESTEHGELIHLIPVAEVLKLHNWIRLSSNIFMNKRNPRHWMERGPSIRRTTFGDFYNLTVSLTRRIVHTALFQAQIRRRGMNGKDKPSVIARDVKCAIEMLGLKENSFDYWVGVPRRHRLKCFVPSPDPKEQDENKQVYVSLPEVEEHLKKEPYKTEGTASDSEDESMDDSSADESDRSESPYESSHVSETDDDPNSDGAGAASVYYSSGATSAWSSDGGDPDPVPILTRQGRRPRGGRPVQRRTSSASSTSSHSSSSLSPGSVASRLSSSSRGGGAGGRGIQDHEMYDFHAATFDAAHEPGDRGFLRRQMDALRTELEAESREEDYLEALDGEASKHEAARLRMLVGEQGDARYATQMQRPKRPRLDESEDDGGESAVGGASDEEWNPAAGLTRTSMGSRPGGHRESGRSTPFRASVPSRDSTPESVKLEDDGEGSEEITMAVKGNGRARQTMDDILAQSAKAEPGSEQMKPKPNPDVERKRARSERQHRRAVRAFQAVGVDTVTRHNWRDVTEYISPWETRILNDPETYS
jgi:hypothetical protein